VKRENFSRLYGYCQWLRHSIIPKVEAKVEKNDKTIKRLSDNAKKRWRETVILKTDNYKKNFCFLTKSFYYFNIPQKILFPLKLHYMYFY